MKKKFFLIFIFCLTLSFSALALSACELTPFNVLPGQACTHTYDAGVIETDATCTAKGMKKFTCTRCGDVKHEEIAAKGHDYANPVSTDATCTTQGRVEYTCSRCGDVKVEEGGYLPHTPSNYYLYTTGEDGQHYKECTVCHTHLEPAAHEFAVSEITHWDCVHSGLALCSCECGYSFEKFMPAGTGDHNYVEVSRTEPTCIADGEIVKECSGCHDVTHETLPMTGVHTYEGHVCLHCKRDMALDYADKFAHGTSYQDAIVVGDKEEITCLLDYMSAHAITSKKYIKFGYSFSGSEEQELQSAGERMTCANVGYSCGKSVYGGETYPYLLISEFHTPSKASGIDYAPSYKEQIDCYEFAAEVNTRNPATVLPYESRTYELSVQSSDQLFYAFAHGYKPVCVANSAAERMLNKAREVCLKMISDDFTDAEKIYVFVSYLTENVCYDFGAVNATEGGMLNWQDCYAWYLEGVFDYNLAVCDGISKALAVLAGIEDIICVQAAGNGHAWNKVYIDADGDGSKEWYVCDPTHANSSSESNEVFMIHYVLFTDAERQAQGFIATNHTECVANTYFNPFTILRYGTGTPSALNDYDHFVETQLEYNDLRSYYNALLNTATHDMLVCVAFDKDFSKTIAQNIFSGKTYSYIPTENLCGGDGYAFVFIVKR